MSTPKSPTSIDELVGTKLRIARRDKGMSQADLGHLTGRTFQQIQKYEKGVNRISAGMLFEFAEALEKDIRWFYGIVSATPISLPISGNDQYETCLRLLHELHSSNALGPVLEVLKLVHASEIGSVSNRRANV